MFIHQISQKHQQHDNTRQFHSCFISGPCTCFFQKMGIWDCSTRTVKSISSLYGDNQKVKLWPYLVVSWGIVQVKFLKVEINLTRKVSDHKKTNEPKQKKIEQIVSLSNVIKFSCLTLVVKPLSYVFTSLHRLTSFTTLLKSRWSFWISWLNVFILNFIIQFCLALFQHYIIIPDCLFI